jgi:hypothetical protein
MTDVAFLVMKNFALPDGGYKLKVRWVLRNGQDMGFIDKVRVKKEHLPNWYEMKDFEAK